MLEVKGQLAKLLAQEDLIIEHRNVSTAQFDVERRVLTLPMWERASETILDLLISHEVGHALYTPNDWSHEGTVPQGFVNVIEDVRIEKMMKRRYAGLNKTFYKGYADFADEDFFQIGDEDIETYSLIDRINLFYKIGNFETIPFTEEEQVWCDRAGAVETFEEVIELAKEIHKYMKKEREQPSQTPPVDQSSEFENLPAGTDPELEPQSSDEQSFDENEGEATGEDEEKNEESTGESPDVQSGGTQPVPETDDEDLVKTDAASTDAIQNLASSTSSPPEYCERPSVNYGDVVIDCYETLHYIDRCWNNQEDEEHRFVGDFEIVDQKFKEFKKSSLREVNYLVKEFEMKKSATAYARATQSRTGVLNTSKLHTYKYNDDIFKKVTSLPNGKNHGLIFNVDWSGSMGDVINDTMKQVINIVTFCRKAGIPFEVYAFTNEWVTPQENTSDKLGKLNIENFGMMNLFSSRMKTKELEQAMLYWFRLSWAFQNRVWSQFVIPRKVCLSGTPLNEAIVALHTIVPNFKRVSKVEKCHVINLTDGEGAPTSFWTMRTTYSGEQRLSPKSMGRTHLRDRKVGRVYKSFNGRYNYNDHTEILVENFKDNFPECSIINIRLITTRDFGLVRRYMMDNDQKIGAEWKKHKSYIDFNSFYTRCLYLHSKSLDDSNNEFDVADDATKTQIKNAFKKSLSNKKTSKRVLSEFISLIA